MRTTLFSRALAMFGIIGGTLIITGGLAVAATPTEQTLCFDGALARTRTEIDADISVSQFDPALGTLLDVAVTGPSIHLDTDAVFESTAGSAVVFAERMDYQVSITSPGGLVAPPPISGSIERVPPQTLAAFDGTLDFVGPSAVTQPSTARDEAAAAVTTAAAPVLSAFTGAGTVPFHLTTAISETFMGGGGNVQFQINTFASAAVRVCYRYAPPMAQVVPPDVVEPPAAPPAAVPTLPATGAPNLPLAGVGLAAVTLGVVLARRWRPPRPTLDS
ncbi:MAG: choice-of-anchor E domain-containing protein [Acidimicrobiia bacterium]